MKLRINIMARLEPEAHPDNREKPRTTDFGKHSVLRFNAEGLSRATSRAYYVVRTFRFAILSYSIKLQGGVYVGEDTFSRG